jgi:hypothetical protein
MAKFPLTGTTIIKLTALYSLIVVLLGLPTAINILTQISKNPKLLTAGVAIAWLLLTVPFLVHALVLYKKWRGAWRFTIVLYGFLFITGFLSGLSKQFANYTLWGVLELILAGLIVCIFWTNLEVKAALGKYKDLPSPAVDTQPTGG